MPAHLTGGKGGGAMENWPTPNQSDMYYAQVGEKESSHDIGKGYLRAEVKIRGKGGGAEVKWRTPDTCAGGAMNQRHLDKTVDDLKKGISPHTLRLQDQVKDERLWPTPRSQEPGRTSVGYGRGLAELVEGKKQKGEGNPMIEQIKNAKKVVLLEPPYKRKYIPLGLSKIATMVKNNGGKVDHQIILQDKTGGQLNPTWVGWLMGWPLNWESLEPLTSLTWLSWEVDPADGEASRVINSTPNRRDWKGKRRNNLENISSKGIRYGTDVCQEVEKLGPGHGPIPRVATGVKDRVNRLQALGNGQVPACVAMAWQMLSE